MNLADHSTQIGCTVDIDKPLFQPTPNFIEFKGFSDFVPVEAVLTLRNQDKVPVSPPRCCWYIPYVWFSLL